MVEAWSTVALSRYSSIFFGWNEKSRSIYWINLEKQNAGYHRGFVKMVIKIETFYIIYWACMCATDEAHLRYSVY